MMKLIFKSLLILSLCIVSLLAKAQIGYDYAQYDLGVAGSANIAASSDVNSYKVTPAVHFNFNYNYTPFVNYVFELQVGRLEGGGGAKSFGRQSENHFTSFIFRGQLQAGEFLDYSNSQFTNFFKNAYVSAGIGYIANHIVLKTPDVRVTNGSALPGDNNAQTPFLPLRIGYEFKIFNDYNQPSVKIDVGYQHNFLFGDNIDGYATGTTNDAYAQFSIGVKFAIGGITSYRKQIHY
jgi:hypothetical protein